MISLISETTSTLCRVVPLVDPINPRDARIEGLLHQQPIIFTLSLGGMLGFGLAYDCVQCFVHFKLSPNYC